MRIANEPAAENAPGRHRERRRPIIERPRLRTAESSERETSWLEFFFDLVFVVAVDQLARRLQGDASGSAVLGYLLLYVPIWWAWVGHLLYVDRFGTDDLSDRVLALVGMAAVLMIAVRAQDALEEGAAAFAVAYGTFRLLLAARYLVAARFVPEVRRHALLEALGFALAAGAWLASALVPSPARFALWGLGVLIDLGTPLLARGLQEIAPPDPRHLEERFGSFVSIAMGVGFVAIVEALREVRLDASAAACAALGLITGFTLWWSYYETLDIAPVELLRREHRHGPYRTWVYGHLPFAAAISAAGVAIGSVIEQAGRPALADEQRWLIAGSLGVGFASLAVMDLGYAAAGGGAGSRRLAARRAFAAAFALGVAAFGRGLSATAVAGLLALSGVGQVATDLWIQSRTRDSDGIGGEQRDVADEHARRQA